ncbi:MAG: site-2 protease family protein [Candidatus Andersenbacteria bacterium]|nr:site-2 protease family protein [Candidatus Andersenbacteria bacterium]
MMWQMALTQAGGDAGLQLVAVVVGLGLAIILHEVAHGWAALYLGDPTAKYAGRLSLNPLNHVDLFGTIILPLVLLISNAGFVFGWAKPVPVNYYNLKYGKYGPALVALAGPATNFVLLIIFGLLARFSPDNSALPILFFTIAATNSILMMFNLIPVPPLDGSKILYIFLEKQPDAVIWLEKYGMYILLALIIFGGGILSRFVFEPAMYLVGWVVGS